jgi:hypothetical protein
VTPPATPGPPVRPGPDPDRYDPDPRVAYGRAGRPVPPPDPPADPLRDPPPGAELTPADRARLSQVRARAGWYVAAHPAATGLHDATADVLFLLDLVVRLAPAPAPGPPRSRHRADHAGGCACDAARDTTRDELAAAFRAHRDGSLRRRVVAELAAELGRPDAADRRDEGVPPDPADPPAPADAPADAALLGRLDGLRAELEVLLDDVPAGYLTVERVRARDALDELAAALTDLAEDAP